MNNKTNNMRYWLLLPVFLMCSNNLLASMISLDDGELSNVSGQALFMAAKEANTTGGGVTHNFYRMGFDAKLELNANIAELKLGETSSGVDVWAKNMALGCVANASNVCVDSAGGTGTQLKPFTLMRPFIQIAVKADSNRATREVVGFRLGAENASGPLSIGNFESFSGYLTAKANIEMQEQGKGTRNPDDIAITCGPSTGPCPRPGGGGSADGRNDFNLEEPLRALGLQNNRACLLVVCAYFEQLTVSYDGVNRTNLPVVLNGRRQTQAFIQNLKLADAVDAIADSITVIRSSGLSADLINAVLPVLIGDVKTKIKNDLAGALGVPLNDNAALNAYQMPYNVQNLHSADINSSLFGLSFQKESVRYPGYTTDMLRGWSMYLPDAFTLSLSEPTSLFVSNIKNGAAAAGNITALPIGGGRNVYDNCWGAAKFC